MTKKQKSLDELYYSALKGTVKEARAKVGGRKLTGYERGTAKYAAEQKFTKTLSRLKNPWPMSGDDSEILEGMARGVYASAWADRQEESKSFFGMDIYEAAPKTPAKAKTWAKRTASKILQLNPQYENLYTMFEIAQEKGYTGDAEHFGYHLGMQSIGHGVSWSDDARQGRHDDFKLPYTDFYLN